MISVSIIIPTYNEERFIKNCLDSVLSFDKLNTVEYEILIIDGKSTDKTTEIVTEYIKNNSKIKLIQNTKKFQAYALNIGIKESTGEWILRLDAHSKYPETYLALLLETALRTNADNTGGIVDTKPYDDSYAASVVQAITTHKFGVGNSGFRIGMKEGDADTVPFGFFNRKIFEKIGYFDERLIRAQDYEFNRRIKKNGGKIWLNPAIQMEYFNQPNLYSFLKKQLIKEAPYNAYMWYVAPYTFAYRHAITGVFTGGLLLGLVLAFFNFYFCVLFMSAIGIYAMLATISAIQQALRFNKIAHVFTLPFAFFSFHFFHGLGVLWGLIRIITKTSPVQ